MSPFFSLVTFAALFSAAAALEDPCVTSVHGHVFGVIEESLWGDADHDHISKMDDPQETEDGNIVVNLEQGHQHSAIGYAEVRLDNGTRIYLAVDPVSVNRRAGTNTQKKDHHDSRLARVKCGAHTLFSR